MKRLALLLLLVVDTRRNRQFLCREKALKKGIPLVRQLV